MPTILSHPAAPLLIGVALGSNIISARLLVAGVVASILPDLDVIGFRFGIAYAHELGHRGFTHSLVFAFLVALIALSSFRQLHTNRKTAFAFVFIAAISHGLFDMLTNGGHGVALLWPFIDERYFFPQRPIEVSPFGFRVFSSAGIKVFASELVWVWVPCAFAAASIYAVRFYKSTT